MKAPYSTIIKITDKRYGVSIANIYEIQTMSEIDITQRQNIYESIELLSLNPNNFNLTDMMHRVLTNLFGKYGYSLRELEVDMEIQIEEK